MNITEIAHLAQVSRATVSRYLNQGYVSEEKRERIRKVIEETNYRPSNFAQTLRRKKTNYIGVIVPKINSDSISRMVNGISQTLSGTDYQLLLACTHNNEHDEIKYLDLFKENHVDGLILLGTIFTPEHKKALKNLSVPIVILGQRLSGYSCVYSDDYHAAFVLVSHLCQHAKTFGYLGVTEKDEAVGENRKKGMLSALAEYHMELKPEYSRLCSFQLESGYEQAKDLLTAHGEIDTLLCATDTLAIGAMKYLKEAKRSVPDSIQIAGIGDSTMSQLADPSLTTVQLYYEEAGKVSARLLLDLIQNGNCEINKEVKLDYRLLIRDSTRH